ncbi:MAG: hypothetical protein R3F49_17295 [Planctomycetota bacterium]
MKRNAIKGRARRRYRSTTNSDHQRPIARNLPSRELTAGTPDSTWCTDITQSATASGAVHSAVVFRGNPDCIWTAPTGVQDLRAPATLQCARGLG